MGGGWCCECVSVSVGAEGFAVFSASASIISSGHIQSELRPECPLFPPLLPGDPCVMEMIRVRVP